MARFLCEPIKLQQIDDYFKLGTDIDMKVFPASTLQGKPFDPTTGKAIEIVEKKEVPVPAYRRRGRTDAAQREYAQNVRRLEEQELNGRLELLNLNEIDHSEIDSTLTGFTQLDDARAQREDSSVAIYESYFNVQHKYDQSLPIFRHREQILRTIDANQATIIQGMTGCGKTTQVSQYIIDDYARQRHHCNIVVTQPRRIAAMSVARRVCEERRWPLGTVCGYQVGLDRKMAEDTRILYCTTGVLLQKLISTKNMTAFTHVIIDEVHERDQDTDFLLLLVRKLLHTTSPGVKVILMSATIETDKFAEYFGYASKNAVNSFDPAPVLSVEGTMYSVAEFYIENLSELGKIPDFRIEEPTVSREAAHICLQLVRQFDEYERHMWQNSGAQGQPVNKVRGSVLVFLPGMGEIQDVMSQFQELRKSHQFMLVPLHSMLTVDEQNMVFEVPLPQFRKIIFATNIAESSITVPDIAYVIDFCLTKVQVSDPDSNYSSLQLQWASKANCVQRKGRAGRVAKGRVYRLVTKAFYHKLPDESVPEIQRCPLEQVILRTKVLDIGEPRLVLGLALDPPNIDDIERSILLLKENGALLLTTPGVAEYNPYDGELTLAGSIIATLPVSVHIGKLILLGHVFGLLHETIIIAAALSQRSLFSRPYQSDLEAFKFKVTWSGNSLSDCFACLKAYSTWENNRIHGIFRNAGAEREWGRVNFVQIRRLREMAELVKELKSRLSQSGIQCSDDIRQLTDDEEIILKVIFAGAFYPNYFQQSRVDEEAAYKEMAGHDRYSTVIVKGLPNQQGHLFRSSIQNLFKVCLPGQPPQVSFEATRAYIQFSQATSLSQLTTKTNPAVYVALKMKLLRDMPLFVTMTGAGGDLSSGEGHMTLPSPRQVDLPASCTTTVPIFVSEVIHCGHCWAQYRDADQRKQLNELNTILTQAVRNSRLQPLRNTACMPGSYCAAPFEDHNVVSFYRARVDRFYGPSLGDGENLDNATYADVFFVDYGNTEKVAIAELFTIDHAHLALPFQAFEVKLCGITPCPIRCPGGRWTEAAKQKFISMVFNKETIIAKVYSIIHGIVRADLYDKISQSSELHVNSELIHSNFAVFAEESLESRQNHMEMERGVLRTRGSSSMATRPLSDAVSVNDTFPLRNPHRIKLQGPWHPYEVKFHSLTQTGRMRSVTVMRDSVNCVAVHDEQVQVNRLLVAAHVSQNSSNNGFTIQDTTLLPSVPGLPALMALVFAQQVELRVDENVSHYTGVLCGLGWNPDIGSAAFPDHDMELIFDTHIDQEDIRLVNYVRHVISQNLSKDRIGMGEETTRRLQQHARDRLMKLLQKKRFLIEPTYNLCQYQWNRIDPELLIRVEHADMDGEHALLPLIQAVNITEGAMELSEVPRSEVEKKRRHVAWLHEMAARTAAEGRMVDVTCELCHSKMLAPRGLTLHLATFVHRQAEAALLVDH